MAKLLAVLRISANSERGALETHRAEIEEWATHERHEIVDWAEDPDVSATKTGPFERPSLGPHLRNGLQGFDGIVFWKLDRIVRKMHDLEQLMTFMRDKKKLMFSVKESWLRFDPTKSQEEDPVGPLVIDMMIRFAGVAAQLEARATSIRVKSKQAILRQFRYWPSGFAPYGFRLEEGQQPGAPTSGKILHVDTKEIAIVRRMIGMVNEGIGPEEIAETLMAEGVETPRQRSRRNRKEDPGPCLWWGKTVSNILTNHSLIGHYYTKGEPLRNDDGTIAEFLEKPPLTREEWADLQRRLEDRKKPHGKPTNPQRALSAFLECLGCGSPLYLSSTTKKATGVVYEQYRCGGHSSAKVKANGGCPAGRRTINAAKMHEILEEAIERDLAKVELTEPHWVEGSGSYEELAQIDEGIECLTDDRANGIYRGDHGTAVFRAKMAELESRRERIIAIGVTPSRWERRLTGKTLWGAWNETEDWNKRKQYIGQARIQAIRVMPGTGELHIFREVDAEENIAAYAAGAPMPPLDRPAFPHPATEYLTKENSK